MFTKIISRRSVYNRWRQTIAAGERRATTQAKNDTELPAKPVGWDSAAWERAKPLAQMPGPSKWSLFSGFLPGGRYNSKSLIDLNIAWRKEYGNIFLLPGLFGKRDIIFTFSPADFETVFRTEGPRPLRRGLDILPHYRKVMRPDVFQDTGGLVAEQGERWAHFRSTVNPVMMNPRTTKFYASKMNRVDDAFMERIRQIRDPVTCEVPADFTKELNYWSFETNSLVALDTELGLVKDHAANPRAKETIHEIQEFFELLFYLDLQPSVWKYVPTPTFKRCIRILDRLTELISGYIDEAMKRTQVQQESGAPPKPAHEQSVLERLIKLDRKVAIVMAMDILLAGVDTSTSALTGCLLTLAKNPHKQQELRKEILQILPNKMDELTDSNMNNMPYLRACIKEAQRVYPVVSGNFRATGQDVVLSGYQVPKGIDVAMPQHELAHDPKYFARPDEFLPERWMRGADTDPVTGCPLKAKEPFLFMPFGFGPRNCIGQRLVQVELEVLLAKLVRNFEISFDYPVKDMFRSTIINVPAKPLKFKFHEVTS